MSKRVLSCILVLVLVIGSATVAFAGNVPPAQQANYPGGASVQYVSVSSLIPSLSITGSTAKVEISVKPKNGQNVSKVEIVGKLLRQGDSNPIKTWSKAILPNAAGKFVWSAKQSLSKRGTYSFEVSVECYTGNTLIETIQANSAQKVY